MGYLAFEELHPQSFAGLPKSSGTLVFTFTPGWREKLSFLLQKKTQALAEGAGGGGRNQGEGGMGNAWEAGKEWVGNSITT